MVDKPVEMAGVVSCNRWGPTQTYQSIFQTIYNMGHEGIPCLMREGVMWHTNLIACMDEVLEKYNPKYLIVFDGDSVFSHKDVVALKAVLDEHNEFDAVCPVQAERSRDLPLVWNGAQHNLHLDYSGALTHVPHGHFGCTIFRADVFAKLPRPWMVDVPNAEGRFEGEWQAQDIYFWNKFNRHGFKLAQANRIVIGHLEFVIRWQKGAEVISQGIHDYRKHGPPPGLRCPVESEVPI